MLQVLSHTDPKLARVILHLIFWLRLLVAFMLVAKYTKPLTFSNLQQPTVTLLPRRKESFSSIILKKTHERELPV